jgi:C1A family cysteine protease
MTEQNLKTFGMGYIPDIPSIEDYTIKNVEEELPKPIISDLNKTDQLPNSIDNRKWCSSIQDQGSLGSCTAQAAVSMMEYMQKKAYNSYQDGSRLFIYWNTRKYMGDQYVDNDSGAYNRLTMKTISKLGIPEETNWPHNINEFKKEPPRSVYDDAHTNKALKYVRLDSDSKYDDNYVNRIKSFLTNGYAAISGFACYDNVYKVTRNEPIIQYPIKGTNELIGGHTVMLCGFNNDMNYNLGKGCFLAQNSWSTNYGDRGFFWIPYLYYTTGLAIDTWTVTDISWVDTGVFN